MKYWKILLKNSQRRLIWNWKMSHSKNETAKHQFGYGSPFFFVWFRDFQTKLTAYWCSALIYTSIFWSHSMEMPFKIIHNFSINNICIKFNGSKENKILLIYRIVFHWRDSFLSLFSEAMAIPNILSYFKIEFFFTSFIKNINHTAYNINL